MRVRAIWLAPLVLMTVFGAYLGLREGRSVAALDETAVIERFARHYVAGVDEGQMRDCSARPGEAQVWLIVECASTPFEPSRHRRYLVGHDGRAIARPDGT